MVVDGEGQYMYTYSLTGREDTARHESAEARALCLASEFNEKV